MKKILWRDANNENTSTYRFPVNCINDEVGEDIDSQIPPMLPIGIVCEFTLEKMLFIAVIITISYKQKLDPEYILSSTQTFAKKSFACQGGDQN